MFNKKLKDELKEEIAGQLGTLFSDFNQRFRDHENALESLHNSIKELKENNVNAIERINREYTIEPTELWTCSWWNLLSIQTTRKGPIAMRSALPKRHWMRNGSRAYPRCTV